MLGVEIYYKQKGSNDEKRVNTIQKGEGYTPVDIRRALFHLLLWWITTEENQKELPLLLFHRIREYLWQIVVRMYSIEQFMDKTKGTFWVSPKYIWKFG